MKPLALARIRNAVIVAPHPDDEAIGAYGLIHRLRRQAARVCVIVVTDGAASHPDSARWPAPKLAALRRRETLAVLLGLGVARADVTFLGCADGTLTVLPGLLRKSLRRAIARVRGCDMLVLPASDDDHPDHRAVTVAIGRQPMRRRYDYLVWPSRQARSREATHYLALGPLASAKRGAIRRYRSQMGAITDDPGGFLISRAELVAFSRPLELFREARR